MKNTTLSVQVETGDAEVSPLHSLLTSYISPVTGELNWPHSTQLPNLPVP